MKITVNGVVRDAASDPETPLLWVLRDELGLTGTKYGCGIGMCGACTVHVGGEARRACVLPLGLVTEPVTTVEGLAAEGGPQVVQAVWTEHQVAQCGYCQPGQIMAATALLRQIPDPTDAEIDAAMAGNLCRCGTYLRIRAAIHAAAGRLARA